MTLMDITLPITGMKINDQGLTRRCRTWIILLGTNGQSKGDLRQKNQAKVLNVEDTTEVCQKDPSPGRTNVPRSDANTDGSFMSNRANWTAIQRQLAQLERQQASLMNMLQDFIGGSHDSMVTLENRVRGLERVVEEMAHDLAMSSGRRVGNMMLGFDKSPGRSSSKYNGLHDYSSSKFGRVGERFHLSDGLVTGVRGRDSPWRSESEAWDSYGYVASRNGVMNTRRGFGAVPVDGRLHKTEHDTDQSVVGGLGTKDQDRLGLVKGLLQEAFGKPQRMRLLLKLSE